MVKDKKLAENWQILLIIGGIFIMGFSANNFLLSTKNEISEAGKQEVVRIDNELSMINNKLDMLLNNEFERYPVNVLMYAFKSVTTKEEVKDMVEMWHEDRWGAQIGALETVCNPKSEGLFFDMMYDDLGEYACTIYKDNR